MNQTISIGNLSVGSAAYREESITAVPSGHRTIGICGWRAMAPSGASGIILSRLHVSSDLTKIIMTYRATIDAEDVTITVSILYE